MAPPNRRSFRPEPVPRPRLVVGGRGLRRTPALAARYADERNAVAVPPAACREQRAALVAACEAAGRDPARIAFSLMTGCVVGVDEADLARRVRRLQEGSGDGRSVDAWVADVGDAWVVGTVAQARERLGELAGVGVEAVMLQLQDAADLDLVDLVAAELAS